MPARLVVVAGHAIPRQFNCLDRDAGWFLKDFQAGEGRFFLEHAQVGAQLAIADPESLLIYSGGQSDEAAGPRSEGQGYWLIAEHFDWFDHPELRARTTTEEFSRDSFENLLFSICRFYEFTGLYPSQIAVVGWAFKAARFDLHRAALRFPAERFRYYGVSQPPNLAESEHFESLRRELFVRDPYGCSEESIAKRGLRNPFRRRHGYAASCPDLAGLLAHRGPEIYSDPLPWVKTW